MSELIVKRNPELIERKVLEQIRAEIEAIEPKSHVQYGMRYADTTLMIPFHKVMQIIDKYAEQKPSEAIQGSTYGGVSWGGTYKPQEPCEDAISREDALEALNAINGTAELDKAFEAVENLPSVRPQEPKTGHWVERETERGTYIECSECGCLAPSTEFADGVWFKKSNFCHDCGAKMV